MSPRTFLEVLKAETMKFQASHPELEAEIARASALIRLGMVTPSPDDPTVGQVLSSDGQKVYHVNSHCDCEAGQHGRACKHVSGWRLYQHIQGKVEAQATPEDIRVDPKNSPLPEVVATGYNLPEAPASCNVRVQVAGREVQWTLRDHDEARLATRLEALLARYPLPQPPAQAASTAEGWCSKHGQQMKENQKDGRRWFSHQVDGQWCKGR
jgi:hypothetical protein